MPSGRRFAAGALASIVAVFGVLALRVHDGDDPALASAKTTSARQTTTSSPASSSASARSDDSSSSGVTQTPGATTSAS